MNTKTNEILNDVIHTASQAIISDDEAIKRQAVGDIIHALARVVPCERAARSAAPTDSMRTTVGGDVLGAPLYKTPDAAMDVVIDNLTPDMIKRICERHGLKRRMTPAEYNTVAEGCKLTRFKGTNATRLVAVSKGREGNSDLLYEISVDHENATAVIERDGEMMYQIKTFEHSYHRCVSAAIQVLRAHLAENNRVNRRHRKSRQRRAGILTPEKELAATVARQTDDDDLAQRIENS